jgi:hypothetical protein
VHKVAHILLHHVYGFIAKIQALRLMEMRLGKDHPDPLSPWLFDQDQQ